MKNRPIQDWVNNPQRNFRYNNVYAVDGVLYSYGPHYPLARFHNQYLLVNTEGYSSATASHISTVYQSKPAYTTLIAVHDIMHPKQGYFDCKLAEAPNAVLSLFKNMRSPENYWRLFQLKNASPKGVLNSFLINEGEIYFIEELGIDLDSLYMEVMHAAPKLALLLQFLRDPQYEKPKGLRTPKAFTSFIQDCKKYGLQVAAVNLAPLDQGKLLTLIDSGKIQP
jgi:hypothetical protein